MTTETTTKTHKELPKSYDPTAVEAEANRVWFEEKCFAADPARPGPPYTIVIPPPNVTGALHLGHAINTTLQDILIRVHRMRGFNTLWVPGIDHAGIATQAVVEKQLKEKENKTRHDVGREELVRRIWAWKEQYGNRIIEQLRRLGCSCDWDRTRFTLDDMCARAVRQTFFKLFKDGLIYRGKRLVNWDVQLQTSISDDEIYHETVKTHMWHIKYPIVAEENLTTEDTEDTEEIPQSSVLSPQSLSASASSVVRSSLSRPRFMIVATTRPETALGDTAVAVHSQDPRWNWAIGKQVRLPLTDRLIPIIADDILVDMEFGSGVVKVTPAHDPNDYAVWQRHQGKPDEIGIINILNPQGTINGNGGKYADMKREAARKKVVEDLTTLGLLEKEEPYETQVGHSDRSKTPIEPYLSDQWFVKMAPLAEPALEVVRNGTIKFFPERHAQQYLAWLGEKRDWPISRQLWWGHRIPVWTATIDYSSSSADLNAKGISIAEHRRGFIERASVSLREYFAASGVNDGVAFAPDEDRMVFVICVRDEKAQGTLEKLLQLREGTMFRPVVPGGEMPLAQIPAFPNDAARQAAYDLDTQFIHFEQDPDVLDTWFSSALWPHSTLGWPDETAELKKYYPTSVLLTGRDIITLWVARMVMTGLYNMGDIPFHHVVINPTILDGKGERMSKSKGNGVDPVEIIDTHGADALRFTLTLMATETQDARLPVKKDAQGRNTSEKFDIGRNFANKLWNAARFTLSNLESISAEPVDESKWSMIDRWIVGRFNAAVAEADAALASYRFDQYAKVCYDFFWRDFCDWYVEAVKPSLKDPAKAAQSANVLAAVLDGTLRLLHPMTPFITETIWWQLNEVRPQRGLPGKIDCAESKRLILAAWPKAAQASAAGDAIATVQDFVTAIRNIRNTHKVSPAMALNVSIIASSARSASLHENQELIEQFGNCRVKFAAAAVNGGVNGAVRVSVDGCDVFIEGLADEGVEQERTGKRAEELAKLIATLKARLDNAGYIAKAPAHLVEQTRQQLADAEAELAKVRGKS
jgi:valyl-tRNA synthetase